MKPTTQSQRTLPVGTKVFTITRKVSLTGNTLIVQFLISRDNTIQDITRTVANTLRKEVITTLPYPALKITTTKGDQSILNGVIYRLARQTYPNGFDCGGTHCPAREHKPIQWEPHEDGGQALIHVPLF